MTYIKSRTFTTGNGRKYEITMTERGDSKDVLDAIDTVVNPEGKRKKMKRSETLKLIRS